MAAHWTPQRSFWLHPADPDRDPDYDADEDYDAYERACEERAELERELA